MQNMPQVQTNEKGQERKMNYSTLSALTWDQKGSLKIDVTAAVDARRLVIASTNIDATLAEYMTE